MLVVEVEELFVHLLVDQVELVVEVVTLLELEVQIQVAEVQVMQVQVDQVEMVDQVL